MSSGSYCSQSSTSSGSDSLLDDDLARHPRALVRDAEVLVRARLVEGHLVGAVRFDESCSDVAAGRLLGINPAAREVLATFGDPVIVRGDGMGGARGVLERHRLTDRRVELLRLERQRVGHLYRS